MKILQENNGNYSSIRAVMVLCALTACAVALLGVYMGRDLLGLTTLVTGLVGAPVAGKVVQKGKESDS